MRKNLVLVGGGHAHLTVLLNLANYVQRGHRVTIIGPSPYHYYSGMGPGMLSGIYRPREVRFHVKKMVQDRGGTFLEDRVMRIDAGNRILFLQSEKQIPYDVVSFNTGSEVPLHLILSTKQENIIPVKPVINLLKARRLIVKNLVDRKMNFIVIGGGPAGVEVAANLWRLTKENQKEFKITLIAGQRLLGGFPDRARTLTLRSFSRRGMEVIEGNHAKEIRKETVLLSDGKRLSFDFALIALGIKSSPLFKQSNLPTGEDGGLLVNSHLQSVAHPEIFGGGDCISLSGHPLAKVGVYAVRQNPILSHNLLAALEGGEMQIFTPQKDYMLIFNMGNSRGIFWRKKFIWNGRLAFLLKDYIDRKFMRKFQVSGEREEPDEII
jgi:NADH dehydrogenase FAD-containing subunit